MKLRIRLGLLLAATAFAGTPASQAQSQLHGVHPPMPDQEFHFFCRFNRDGIPSSIEVPLNLPSPSFPGAANQDVEVPGLSTPIRLGKYLPQASLDQHVEADKTGKSGPAVQLVIAGASQTHRRWLIAGDDQRNRVTSFIGTWRYMAVENSEQRDDLYRQFVNEFTRPPMITVSSVGTDAGQEIPAKAGHKASIAELGCEIRVLKFFPHFAIDDKNKNPTNQSDARINPAALIEIKSEGTKVERWVFSKFPGFNMNDETALDNIHTRLDCPLDDRAPIPDYALVNIAGERQELWKRFEGKTESQALKVAQKTEIDQSGYAFHIEQYQPSGLLVETYQASKGKGGQPALSVLVPGPAGGTVPLWLGLNKQRSIPTPKGTLTLWFGTPRNAGTTPAGSGQH